MKILHIINALTHGGAQIVVSDLGADLVESGSSVVVAAFRDGPLRKSLESRGIRIEILGESPFDIPAYFKIRHLIDSFRPEIVHSHLSRATFWARMAIRENGPVLISSVHGFETDYYHRLESKMSRYSDYTVFPSSYLKNWYCNSIRQLPSEKVRVIFPGTPVFELLPSVSRSDDDSPVKIGTFSRLHHVKGIDLLIQASGMLAASGMDFSLQIAGAGPQLGFLKGLVERFGLADRISFICPDSTGKSFLESLDLFVASSRQESFGITICEAMERGLPVVATSVGGIREIIRDGIDGLLFPQGDPRGLAKAIDRVVSDWKLRQSIGRNARLRIVSSFRRSSAIDSYNALYADIRKKLCRRVHFAVSSGELGGGERMAVSLASALNERGWSVSATCTGKPLEKAFSDSGIVSESASKRLGGAFFALRLLRQIKNSGVTLVNTHLNRAAIIAGFLRRLVPIKIVAHIHGLNRSSYYEDCDRVIAVSGAVGQHILQQGFPGDKLSVIPNCIFESSHISVKPVGPPWIIAIIAKLHPNKGHYWALEALEANLQKLPRHNIWIFGDGSERHRLEERFGKIRNPGWIKFFGYRKDLSAYFQQIHLVLLPSLGEGRPLSILEAMAWGVPCVATRTGGLPELVDDGLNGLLVEPRDSEALVRAVSTVLAPVEWQRLSIGALQRFSKENNFEGMISSFEKLLLSGEPV